MEKENGSISGNDEPIKKRNASPDNCKLEIIAELRESYREKIVVCCVCDEFCVLSELVLYSHTNLPEYFFKLLSAPDGKRLTGAPVLPPQLLEQYSISNQFPTDRRFHHVLLSPRGVEQHALSCIADHHQCVCAPKLRICNKIKGCSNAFFKRKRTPKFAIAQGNWIGHLP